MIFLDTDFPKILGELEDVVRLFQPEYKRGEGDKSKPIFVSANPIDFQEPVKIFFNNSLKFSSQFDVNYLPKIRTIDKEFIWHIKKTLFKALQRTYDVQLPYGCLTGIRPTKLVHALSEGGIPHNALEKYLVESYFLSPEKASLVTLVFDTQLPYISKKDGEVDLYIHIPFCPSRCKYCSFLSSDYKRNAPLIRDYLKALFLEIDFIKNYVDGSGKDVRSVYIGGGTPTVLSAEELKSLLNILPFAKEFTLEAGRPETITREKLEVMTEKVTRISINPQTFNENVLKMMGREHTNEDIDRAFKTARNFPFDINMDLIAGLNGDNLSSFKETLSRTVSYRPENITVHTFCVKRTADMTLGNLTNDAENMIEYVHENLQTIGYDPYYMYRQKYMSGNLENTGYSLQKKPCLFNIDTMEENVTILAAGAGAISKVFYPKEKRIERAANVKNISDYIKRIEEMINRKRFLL